MPNSSARAAAALTHRSDVDRDALLRLSSWPMLPNCSALVRATCSST